MPDVEQRVKAIAAADRQVNRCTLRPLKDSRLITVVRPFLLGETTPLARKEVVVLTATGAAVVRQHYTAAGQGQQLRWRRDWLAIDNTNQVHASLLSDWYILLRRALTGPWSLAGWRDDRDLAQLTQQGQTRLTGIIPDAALVLTHTDQQGTARHVPFLVELDLGTEPLRRRERRASDWSTKVERYLAYFAAASQGDPLWRGIASPPRVLTLTTSPERVAHLVTATRRASGDDRFWFATIQLLCGDADPAPTLWTSRWSSPSAAGPVCFRDLLESPGPSFGWS